METVGIYRLSKRHGRRLVSVVGTPTTAEQELARLMRRAEESGNSEVRYEVGSMRPRSQPAVLRKRGRL